MVTLTWEPGRVIDKKSSVSFLVDSGGAEPGPTRAWARASLRRVNYIHIQ